MQTEENRQAIPNSVGRGVLVAISILLQVFWIVGLAYWLRDYYAAIQTLCSVLALAVGLRIYGLHINSAYKISWIILIGVFPVFGLCVYLLFGRQGAASSVRRYFNEMHTHYQPYYGGPRALPTVLQEGDRSIANQAAYLQNTAGYPVYSGTDVTYYGNTCDALAAQQADLRKAERFIFMEYHAIDGAAAWQSLEDILAERAAAGVEVCVFYDDMGSLGFISNAFVKRLESRGIQCRVFNPLLPVLNVFMNNRDHRKITVIDNRVGYTGGYNLADEYFNYIHPYGQWKDSGIRLEGDAVASLTLTFLEMWCADKRQQAPLPPEKYLLPCDYTPHEHAAVLPYADSPLDELRTGEDVYLNMIRSAKEYIYITTPYLIISDEMQRALVLAASSGVDVRIITPGIPDKKLIYSVTRSYYAGLIRGGVKIYEYTPGFLHAKQCLADGKVAVVGTINYDYRSLYLHFENACWFCGCQAVEDLRRDFDELFAVSTDVSERYRDRNLALRGMQCILRLFSPLM